MEIDKNKIDLALINQMHNTNPGKTWLTRGDLFDILRSEEGEQFSDATLHNELQELQKKELIVRRRFSGRRYTYEYAANRLIDNSMFFNPDISQITDSKYKGNKTKVINLFDGQTEEI